METASIEHQVSDHRGRVMRPLSESDAGEIRASFIDHVVFNVRLKPCQTGVLSKGRSLRRELPAARRTAVTNWPDGRSDRSLLGRGLLRPTVIALVTVMPVVHLDCERWKFLKQQVCLVAARFAAAVHQRSRCRIDVEP